MIIWTYMQYENLGKDLSGHATHYMTLKNALRQFSVLQFFGADTHSWMLILQWNSKLGMLPALGTLPARQSHNQNARLSFTSESWTSHAYGLVEGVVRQRQHDELILQEQFPKPRRGFAKTSRSLGQGIKMVLPGKTPQNHFSMKSSIGWRGVVVVGGVVTFELPMLTFELPMLTFELPMLTFELPHAPFCRNKHI